MTTILIADGDGEFVDTLRRALRRQRYTVLTASNKREALAHLEAEAKRQIEVELEEAKMGYWRMKPFLEKISEALALQQPSA